MQDQDPNSSRPPDPRPRPRSHKSKNAQKRQPQRGLGVAQLEKLRLEEQSKQQDALCLNSLQQHHHGYLQPHHNEHEFPHRLHHQYLQHEQQFQLPQQTTPLSLCSQIKVIEAPQRFTESHCPLGLGIVENVHNGFLPFAAMANRGHGSPVPVVISPQQLGNANERNTKPSSATGITAPLIGCAADLTSRAPCTATFGLSVGEILWHNRPFDQVPVKEEGFTSSPPCLGNTVEIETHSLEWDPSTTSEDANAASEYLHGGHGSLHRSKGKRDMPNESGMAPLTDLCLLHPRRVGGADLHTPERPRPDLAVIGNGVLTRELSSFQSMSLSSPWLAVNKASNRKRSWECAQELISKGEAFTGLDLNATADEIDLEAMEQSNDVIVPLSIRDSRCSLPPESAVHKTDNSIKKWLRDKVCTEAFSPRMTDAMSSATFLSLRKLNLELEPSGEFLTLGPSCSSIHILENFHVAAKDCNGSPSLRKSSEGSSTCQPQHMLCEGENFSIALASTEKDESMLPLDDHQACYRCTSLPRHIELTGLSSWSKGGLHQQSGDDGALDLELRLSL